MQVFDNTKVVQKHPANHFVLEKFYKRDFLKLPKYTYTVTTNATSFNISYICLIFLLLDLTTLLPRFHFSNSLYNHGRCGSSKKCKRFHLKEEFKLLAILFALSLGCQVYCLKTVSCHDLHLFSRKQPTTTVSQFIQ